MQSYSTQQELCAIISGYQENINKESSAQKVEQWFVSILFLV